MRNFSRAAASRIAALALLCSLHLSPVISPLNAQVAAPNADASAQLATPPSGQIVINRVLDNGVEATLTIPRSWIPGGNKARIALYESGRPAIIAEAKRNFTIQSNGLQTTLRLEIAPGSYEMRLVKDDKTRAPLSPSVGFQINGLRREPGAWLLNGSPFVSQSASTSDSSDSSAPLFIKGLKRDLGAKTKAISRNIYTKAPLSWQVLEVSAIDIAAPDFDFAAFQTRLQKQIADAQSGGQRNYLGVVLSNKSFGGSPFQAAALRNATLRIRQIINIVAPDAALILQVDDFAPLLSPQIIEICAPFSDAVILESNAKTSNNVWVLKMLRRITEEQPNYDLPIFVSSRPQIGSIVYDDDLIGSQQTDLLMSGATSLIEYSNDDLRRIVRRNASLFIGAVTIEDIGLLSAPESTTRWTFNYNESILNGNAIEIYHALRDIGRIPLVARLPLADEKKAPPETFLLRVGERISADTLARLRANVERGVRVYIEGTPRFDIADGALKKSWEELVGGVSTADEKGARPTTVKLSDPWTFGAHSGAILKVQQNYSVVASKTTLANRAKTEKGVDVITAPRVLATTEDGAPALILGAVGKGEVLWMPHRVLDVLSDTTREYYNAIAAQVQSGLVTLRDENGEPLQTPIRVALRRSPQGVLILALFNSTSKNVSLRTSLDGIATVALDLSTEAELEIARQGNQSAVKTTISANSWKLIAFGEERKTFDAARNAPLFRAQIK